MEPSMEKYKGIHPGLVLERELKKRYLKKGPFAISLKEYPQILNEITKGRRGLTPALSLKIDYALGFEEGTMFSLQAWYEIQKEKERNGSKKSPDLSLLSKALFWDTDIEKIDWLKQYRAVIKRTFERGNDQEKKEILRFYGEDKVREVTGSDRIKNNRLPLMPHARIK